MLLQIPLLTTCISGIFDLGQNKDGIFFYGDIFLQILSPRGHFLYTFFVKCENFAFFYDFLNSPLDLGPEKWYGINLY